MYFMSSKVNKMFYFKLLFVNKRNCTSFENLKIVFIQIKNVNEVIVTIFYVCNNFKNVCVALNFTNNDNE